MSIDLENMPPEIGEETPYTTTDSYVDEGQEDWEGATQYRDLINWATPEDFNAASTFSFANTFSNDSILNIPGMPSGLLNKSLPGADILSEQLKNLKGDDKELSSFEKSILASLKPKEGWEAYGPTALTIGGNMLAGAFKSMGDTKIADKQASSAREILERRIQADKEAAEQLVKDKRTTVAPITVGKTKIAKVPNSSYYRTGGTNA